MSVVHPNRPRFDTAVIDTRRRKPAHGPPSMLQERPACLPGWKVGKSSSRRAHGEDRITRRRRPGGQHLCGWYPRCVGEENEKRFVLARIPSVQARSDATAFQTALRLTASLRASASPEWKRPSASSANTRATSGASGAPDRAACGARAALGIVRRVRAAYRTATAGARVTRCPRACARCWNGV